VNKKSLDSRPEVKAFVEYALGEGLGAVEESDYVKLPNEAYELIQNRFKALSTGSIFMKAEAGKSTVDILKAAK
jgi:phosphate transport system substrate-binding protein